nr:MAG TPA: hypothetical protein [Caudoviricetes sp.]
MLIKFTTLSTLSDLNSRSSLSNHSRYLAVACFIYLQAVIFPFCTSNAYCL